MLYFADARGREAQEGKKARTSGRTRECPTYLQKDDGAPQPPRAYEDREFSLPKDMALSKCHR